MTEAVGLPAAALPHAWLGLFGHDPAMLATGAAYLRRVGPIYGFFGGGLACISPRREPGACFGRWWPGSARVIAAVGGGWLLLSATGSLTGLYAALGAGLVLYGVVNAAAIRGGAWFRRGEV